MVFVVGGGIELVQLFIGREASLEDMGVNLVGAGIGLALAASAQGVRIGLLARGVQVLVFGAGLALIAEPVATLWDMRQASRQFPMLSDFENRLQAKRWTSGKIVRNISRQGQASLCVHLDSGETYPGTTLTHSFGDWQGYAALELSILNPDPLPLQMFVSIRDLEHRRHQKGMRDRFDRSFFIQPGWNDLRVPIEEIRTAPKDRPLNLGQLSSLVIFTMSLTDDRIVYLDQVRLVQ
ncbi:VanZ family protein [Desulfonatronum parangueonense]